MNNPVTILDVAAYAKVSPATVTHALNGKRPVSEATKAKVLEAVRILGYVPSWNASRLKVKRSGIIGCIAVDITENFVNQIVRGIEQGLNCGEYSLFFVSAFEFGNDYKKAYDFLKGHQVDGILYCHHLPFGQDFPLEDMKNGVPIVSVNMSIPGIVSVIPDNYTGGYQAAEHLYSCGMRHPAIICGPEDRLSVQDRLRGFSVRVKELGLQLPDSAYSYGPYDFEHGYEAAKEQVQRFPLTDGIFCANDYIAAGAITALKELGLDVPSRVRVLGFDNRDFSGFWTPTISTFEQPLQEMGLLAFGLLKNMIATGAIPQESYQLQSRLIPRQSTFFVH